MRRRDANAGLSISVPSGIDPVTGRFLESSPKAPRNTNEHKYLCRSVERICLLCDHDFTMDKPTISAMLDEHGHLLPDWQRDVLHEWCSRQ